MTSFSEEIRALVKLALPVSLAQLAIMGMGATDVLIAGQAGTIELAGMNLGNNIWHMIVLFFMGIGFATQPLVAKQFGAQNDEGVKKQFHQSVWLCFGLGAVATIAVIVGAKMLLLAPFELSMRLVAYSYLIVMSLCALPITLLPALRGTLEGMSLTKAVLLINFSAFLLNIPLDYILVNGLYGFPKLGAVGCAWATVFLTWLMFTGLVLMLYLHKAVRKKHLLRNFLAPDKTLILSTLKLGFPIGISIVIELSMFSGAGILIAMFGSIQASAHAVALTIAAMSFMLYMGIGQGVTIRASQFLGAQKPDHAWHSVRVGTIFNLMVAVVICILFVVFNRHLVALFSDDGEVIELAVVLLLFGAAFQLADSLQVAIVSALRAYHDTVSPPKYQFIAFWVFGLPIGVGFAFYEWLPGFSGAKGLWLAMVMSLFLVGLLLLRRLMATAGVRTLN